MHTVWVREHNRVADEIAAENPDFSDEEIYQAARRIVIGELQAITYNEYLPALLGRGAIDSYEGYDPSVDASDKQSFRHRRLSFTVTQPCHRKSCRLDDSGEVIDAGNLALRDAFFNPDAIIEGGIDSVLKGLSAQRFSRS